MRRVNENRGAKKNYENINQTVNSVGLIKQLSFPHSRLMLPRISFRLINYSLNCDLIETNTLAGAVNWIAALLNPWHSTRIFSLFSLQMPVIPTSHSNVRQMVIAFPFSICATVRPTVPTATMKTWDYARQVKKRWKLFDSFFSISRLLTQWVELFLWCHAEKACSVTISTRFA